MPAEELGNVDFSPKGRPLISFLNLVSDLQN